MAEHQPQTMGEFMAFTRRDTAQQAARGERRDLRSNERDAGREKDEAWWVARRDDVARQV